MYVPGYAALDNLAFLHEFVEKHAFGTLISRDNEGKSFANHFPFLLEAKIGSPAILWTHMARNNPQWEQLRRESQCLAIFQGPQAYISPNFYVGKLNVPTWNYTAVHAECRAEILESPGGIEDILQRSLQHFEKSNKKPWQYDLPRDFRDRLVKAIVGVKLTVNNWQGKFKLSQNRNKDDYEAVLQEFESRNDENSRELLRYLKLTRPTHL